MLVRGRLLHLPIRVELRRPLGEVSAVGLVGYRIEIRFSVEVLLQKSALFPALSSHSAGRGQDDKITEEKTGKKCFLLSVRHPDFVIIWGGTPEYWRHRTLAESRFSEVSELLAVCWLEIFAKIDTRVLSPKTKYKAYIIIKFAQGWYGLDWDDAEMSITVGDHTFTHAAYLKPVGVRRRMHWDERAERVREVRGDEWLPQMRSDGWMEIEMGEFTVGGEGGEGDVTMRMLHTRGGNWKGGLIVEGIEIRPID